MISLGVDIGGTKMMLLVEYKGEKVSRTVPTGKECTPDKIRKEIIKFVSNLPFTIDCMGVAVPGLVEQGQKVVISDVLPHIAGMDANFLKINNIPVYMINDVKAALIRETNLNKNIDTVVIMVGTGIAAGIRQNGHFTNGHKGWAGELGSIPISTEIGIKTLDELASGASIIARANTDANTLNKRLEQNDNDTREVIRSAGGYLGLGISTVINLLNPQRIILGGGTIKYDGYFESAVQVAKKNTLPELWEVCTVEKSKEAKHMVAQGAMHFAGSKEER